MDRIFIQINQTFSSPGEDILYNILRRPVFNEEILEEREKLIHFFDTHEKERTDLQLILASIGKTRLGSLADTVLALNDAPVINIKIHILMLVALLVSIFVLLPMYPMMGFLVFMCLMIANIAIYYASAGQQVIEAYMDCFNHLLKMLEAADQMQIVKYPEAQKQMEAIAEGKRIPPFPEKSLSDHRQKCRFRRSFSAADELCADGISCGHSGIQFPIKRNQRQSRYDHVADR